MDSHAFAGLRHAGIVGGPVHAAARLDQTMDSHAFAGLRHAGIGRGAVHAAARLDQTMNPNEKCRHHANDVLA